MWSERAIDCFVLLYNKSLNDWSREEQWILFPSNLKISLRFSGDKFTVPKGPVIKWSICCVLTLFSLLNHKPSLFKVRQGGGPILERERGYAKIVLSFIVYWLLIRLLTGRKKVSAFLSLFFLTWFATGFFSITLMFTGLARCDKLEEILEDNELRKLYRITE